MKKRIAGRRLRRGKWKTVVLDTSAFRSLSHADLRWLHSRGYRLVASTYSFWEIFSHLDEPGEYERFVAELMKFRDVEIVDPPVVAGAVGTTPEDGSRIVRDSEMIYAALAAVRASLTLKQFQMSVLVDEAGQSHSTQDSATKTRSARDSGEKKFMALVSDIVRALDQGDTNTSAPAARHSAIMDLLQSDLRSPIPDFEGMNDEEKIARCYVYWSYILHRAVEVRDHGGTCAKHDFEDSMICRCIHLRRHTQVVTQDAGLARCLISARCTLRDVGEGGCVKFYV